MAKIKDASNGLKTASNEVKALEAKFKKLEELQGAARAINKRVAAKLTSTLQKMLTANYSKQGVGIISGELKKAVAGSYVVVTGKGLRIQLGKGFPKKVYVRASVHRKYKGFYGLTAADITTLQNDFTRLWQAEVQRYLGEN